MGRSRAVAEQLAVADPRRPPRSRRPWLPGTALWYGSLSLSRTRWYRVRLLPSAFRFFRVVSFFFFSNPVVFRFDDVSVCVPHQGLSSLTVGERLCALAIPLLGLLEAVVVNILRCFDSDLPRRHSYSLDDLSRIAKNTPCLSLSLSHHPSLYCRCVTTLSWSSIFLLLFFFYRLQFLSMRSKRCSSCIRSWVARLLTTAWSTRWCSIYWAFLVRAVWWATIV